MSGNYRSKDGQWYENGMDAMTADQAWEEKQGLQKEQNRLIQEQTQMLEEQNRLNREIEKEKIEKNHELELQKMSHDEKMRILNLFDNIGISKETYDNYVNKNILNKEYKELDDLIECVNNLEYFLRNSAFYFGSSLETEEDEFDYLFDDSIKIKREIISSCYEIDKKYEKKLRREIRDLEEKVKFRYFISVVLVFGALLLTLCICMNDFESSGFETMLIIVVMASLIYAPILLYRTLINDSPKIKEMKAKKSKPRLNIEKCEKKLKEKIKNEKDKIKNKTEEIILKTGKEIEDFNNFRLNHYNSNIEKLLVDVGFKKIVEDLGLEYKKVNNSNKKKNGTIEDYVDYFENHS